MEEISLTDTETRYFNDLFLCCDEEKTGKIPILKATELFRSAYLQNAVIDEITSICGIPSTALHISKVQFFSCLKLIAAHQASMTLRPELIGATVQLSLPRFSWKDPCAGSNESNIGSQFYENNQLNGVNSILSGSNHKNATANRRNDWQETQNAASGSRRNSSTQQQQQQQQHQESDMVITSDIQSTDSEVEQNESSCGGVANECTGGSNTRELHRRRGSPEAWSTNSDSPTPTNSVAERPWAKETLWHGILGDEHRQLLGTEEESSDRHSSDDENDTAVLASIYEITNEQREYYNKQFKTVQHDVNGLVSGHVARIFFEKSRIPVDELRHIWQLCDVTRDGALSLEEFTAAMHLVVLRRNNIPLPTGLPTCLYPSHLKNVTMNATIAPTTNSVPSSNEPPEADLLHLNDDDENDGITSTDGIKVRENDDKTLIEQNSIILNNETNVMNISTLSASSQTSTNSKQGITGINNQHSITPQNQQNPAGKDQSETNSPNVGDTNLSPPSNLSSLMLNNLKEPNLWGSADAPATQWTKFSESPTSNLSSPGPKPLNFDMQRTAQAVVSDPQILHPVPLRVTPVATAVNTIDGQTNDIHDSSILRDNSPKLSAPAAATTVTVVTSSTAVATATTGAVVNATNMNLSMTNASVHRDSLQNNDLRAIQRPQAKKIQMAKNIGALPPPPQRETNIITAGISGASVDGEIPIFNSNQQQQQVHTTQHQQQLQQLHHQQQQQQQQYPHLLNKGKEPPPLPPPRPPHRHGRSSSLDLNKFKMNPTGEPTPTEKLAQTSFDLQTNSSGFADFTQFSDSQHDQQQHSLPVSSSQTSTTSLITSSATIQPMRLSLQHNQRVSAFEVYRKPNTPRNSQSPQLHNSSIANASVVTQQQQQQQAQPQPVTIPFGAGVITTVLPNADLYEKRVSAISETLRHVTFKQNNNNNNNNNHNITTTTTVTPLTSTTTTTTTANNNINMNSMADILRHLREQNQLLLHLCNDLSDELLQVQARKEEMRLKLETSQQQQQQQQQQPQQHHHQQQLQHQLHTQQQHQQQQQPQHVRTGSSISAPVTANVTGGSINSGINSNV